MGTRDGIARGVLGLVLGGSGACAKPAPVGTAAPVVPPRASAAEGAATTEAEPAPAADELPASAEAEWVESPLEADLDGDGVAESIAWTCGGTLTLEVGRARLQEAYSLVEEQGCGAAVVALRPGGAARQLMIVIDEHDEVGPDLHLMVAYREGRLETVWSDRASVDVLVDGSWVTETHACYEGAGYLATYTGRHRWDGEAVTSEEDESRTPVEPGDCAEP